MVCRGHRHGLRARRDGADDGLRVETCTLLEARWRRVDHDVVALTRAATRLVALDPSAARATVEHAIELASIPARDTHPVTGLVRATLPLLATPHPWPLAGLPDAVPSHLLPVLRARDPRAAARALVGDRATRPVARALSEQLVAWRTVDVLLLDLVAVAGPLLEPDHLARLLRPTTTPPPDDRAALNAGGVERLRGVLAGTPPRRVLALLSAAVGDGPTRRRVRFVAGCRHAGPGLDLRQDWSAIALQVVAASPDRA